MGKILDKIFKKPKKILADYLQETLDRPNDPMLTAIGVESQSNGVLIFVSTLELNSELEEAPHWKTFRLESGEKKVLPHHYWSVSSINGADCCYKAFAAPKDSDFIYKRRTILNRNTPLVEHNSTATPDRH